MAILSGFRGVVWAQGLGCQWVNNNKNRNSNNTDDDKCIYKMFYHTIN